MVLCAHRLLAVLLALVLGHAGAADGAEYVFKNETAAIEDTFISCLLYPSVNYNVDGNNLTMYYNVISGAYGSPEGEQELFFKVKPDEAIVGTITDARLTLRAGHWGLNQRFNVLPGNSSWDEGTLSCNNMPFINRTGDPLLAGVQWPGTPRHASAPPCRPLTFRVALPAQAFSSTSSSI